MGTRYVKMGVIMDNQSNTAERVNVDENCFEKPSVMWLDEKFSRLSLGSLKASELEIYLAYMLMYHRGELNTDSFLLADKYGMSEQKIRKMQVEFARRFVAQSNENSVKIIADGIFGGKDCNDRIVLDVSDDQKKISFSVKNAAWMHELKRLLAEEGLTWREERNPRAITLETQVFAYVFRDRLELPLSGILVNDAALQNVKMIGKSFSEIPKATFLLRVKKHIPEILSAVANVATVVGTVASFGK